MKQCKSVGCFKPAAKDRNECNTCRSKRWIAKNRIRFTWHMIKKSAKRRNIIFFISYKYFEKLILKSGYIKSSGRLKDSLTVDRIDNEKGYIYGNLQVITKSENSIKYHHIDKVVDGITRKTDDEDDLPF